MFQGPGNFQGPELLAAPGIFQGAWKLSGPGNFQAPWKIPGSWIFPGPLENSRGVLISGQTRCGGWCLDGFPFNSNNNFLEKHTLFVIHVLWLHPSDKFTAVIRFVLC